MEVARLRKAGLALEKALDAGGAEVREPHKARIEADADILGRCGGSLREMLEIHGGLSKLRASGTGLCRCRRRPQRCAMR